VIVGLTIEESQLDGFGPNAPLRRFELQDELYILLSPTIPDPTERTTKNAK